MYISISRYDNLLRLQHMKKKSEKDEKIVCPEKCRVFGGSCMWDFVIFKTILEKGCIFSRIMGLHNRVENSVENVKNPVNYWVFRGGKGIMGKIT